MSATDHCDSEADHDTAATSRRPRYRSGYSCARTIGPTCEARPARSGRRNARGPPRERVAWRVVRHVGRRGHQALDQPVVGARRGAADRRLVDADPAADGPSSQPTPAVDASSRQPSARGRGHVRVGGVDVVPARLLDRQRRGSTQTRPRTAVDVGVRSTGRRADGGRPLERAVSRRVRPGQPARAVARPPGRGADDVPRRATAWPTRAVAGRRHPDAPVAETQSPERRRPRTPEAPVAA